MGRLSRGTEFKSSKDFENSYGAFLALAGERRTPTFVSFSRERMMLKERLSGAVIAIAACITFAASPSAEEKFQRLNGQQIRAKFAGMELTDQSHWGDVFQPNGTLATYSMGHKSLGKWRVQKDQLCLDRGNEPGGGCYEVWLAGKKVELRNQVSNFPLEGVLQRPTDRP
jgi:hypothetical protein